MDQISRSNDQMLVSYINTDINSAVCLEDARQALVALPGVEAVTVDSAVGCFVVTHNSALDRLVEVITRHGCRVAKAASGELGMGPVTAVPLGS